MITAAQYLARREMDAYSPESDPLIAPRCDVSAALAFLGARIRDDEGSTLGTGDCDFELDQLLICPSGTVPGSIGGGRLFQICARHTADLERLERAASAVPRTASRGAQMTSPVAARVVPA